MTTQPLAKLSAVTPPELLFCSPDRARAQRLTVKLQSIGKVAWEPDIGGLELARHANAKTPILLDFSAATANASAELARKIEALAPQAPMIAIGSTHAEHSAGVLCALRAGLRDFIDLDASADEARTVIRHVLERVPASVATATPTPAASRRRTRSVVLMGVREGMGTSTMAAHLGVLAQHELRATARRSTVPDHPGSVLLLDLGRPEGDCQLYLDVRGDFYFNDAVHNAFRLDSTLARTAFPKHSSELAVLSHSPLGTALPSPSESDIGLLLERVLDLFDLLLIDVGGITGQEYLSPLLQTADDIWLVADQSVGALVSLDITLHNLKLYGAPRDRIKLIVNRYIDAEGVSPEQLADRFEVPLLAVIPERGRALRSSSGIGKLLSETAPGDRYVRALSPLLADLSSNPSLSTRGHRHSRLLQWIDALGGHRWKRT